MRFPIKTKQESFGTVYANLSDALQESLADRGTIDPKSEAVDSHFDLPIEEGPLLTCLSWFYDMAGNFHVGCTTDLRPPSFGFGVSQGSYDTREGAFSFNYWKQLKLSVFWDNHSFRNVHRVRDLDALAEAYNNHDNCTEKIGLGWSGWTGKEYESRKTGFSSRSLALEFVVI
jgi:hypothetical protein